MGFIGVPTMYRDERTDLREALVKTSLEDLDKTQAHLEEWGYGLDV